MNRHFRSAISGRWVTRLFARANPATTVSETSAKPVELRPRVRCSFCLKEIPWDSVLCPHCQSELDDGRGCRMTYALDISQFSPGQMGGPLTDDMVTRCLARGIDRFIVSTVDKDIAREQIAVLVRHPVEIQTYHAYEWATFKAAQPADVAFIAEVRQTYNLQKHWIDVESQVKRPVAQNIADVHWLVDSFTGICPTGLYSSPGWWQQYMGDTDEFAHVPWWVAHWNGKDSLTDFLHFGGITSCEMHQTLNDLFVEGVWCDTNYYERVTPDPQPPYPPVNELKARALASIKAAEANLVVAHEAVEAMPQ